MHILALIPDSSLLSSLANWAIAKCILLVERESDFFRSCSSVSNLSIMMSMKTSNCKMSVMLHLIFFAALAPFAAAFSRREYADALEKSILFFDVQRSGHLPAWQRITWRADSGLHDGHQDNASH